MTVLNDEIYPRSIRYEVTDSSTGPFAIPFPFYDNDTVQVTVDNSQVVDFTIIKLSPDGTAGNEVVLTDPVSNAIVHVYSSTGARRILDSIFVAAELSIEIDRIYALFQETIEAVGVFLSDSGTGEPFNDLVRRVTALEEWKVAVDLLLQQLVDTTENHQEQITDVDQKVDQKTAEALAEAQEANQIATDTAGDLLTVNTDLTKKTDDTLNYAESINLTLGSEIDALTQLVDNIDKDSIPIDLVLDDHQLGAKGAAIATAVTGPADLGRDGTVRLTQNATPPVTTIPTNGWAVEIPHDRALKFVGRKVRIALLARVEAGHSGDFSVAYSTSHGPESGLLPLDSNNLANGSWKWHVFFSSPVASQAIGTTRPLPSFWPKI